MGLTEDLAMIQVILTRYILVICGILGILGSLFNLIIFTQKKLRTNSCSVYFISTSIFNLLVIIFGITPVLLMSYLPDNSALNSSIFCKFRTYTTHTLLMLSRSSVALACIDRFALSSRSVHIRRLNQFHIAIKLIIIISILWLIIPIHTIIYIDIQMPGYRCGAVGIYLSIYSAYASIVTTIPLIIMIIFSCIAVQSIRCARARVSPATLNVTSRIRKRDIHLMTILIGEVIVYFFSTVWFPLYTIYLTFTLNEVKSANRQAIEGFIRYLVLSFIIFLNSCSIFYIHLLASKVFRQECKQWLIHLFKRNEINQRIQRTSQVSIIRNQLNIMYDLQPIHSTKQNEL